MNQLEAIIRGAITLIQCNKNKGFRVHARSLFLLSYYRDSDNKLKLHYMLGGLFMAMKTRGVSFNVEDPEQSQLYKYTQTINNFSGYIKELIRKDRASKTIKKVNPGGNPGGNPPNSGGIKITL